LSFVEKMCFIRDTVKVNMETLKGHCPFCSGKEKEGSIWCFQASGGQHCINVPCRTPAVYTYTVKCLQSFCHLKASVKLLGILPIKIFSIDQTQAKRLLQPDI